MDERGGAEDAGRPNEALGKLASWYDNGRGARDISWGQCPL